MPDFELTAFDGSPVRLADYRGQVVVVNFFASWCAPCRQEAADVPDNLARLSGSGSAVLGHRLQGCRTKAQAFLDEFGLDYPSAVDPGNRTASAYGVTGVPETFVIDQQGNLVRHFLGAVTQAELQHELDALLSP